MKISAEPKLSYLEINSILTLRYNPYAKTDLRKLEPNNFSPSQLTNPSQLIENSLKKSIRNFISENSIKTISIPLSGGIDSTLILTLFKNVEPSINIKAISVKFPDSPDETITASKIASVLDVDHQIISLENILEKLPKAISIVKQPFWDIHWFYVAETASKFSNNLTTGDGGDELFGGYTFRYQKFLSNVNNDSTPFEKVKEYLKCHERDHVEDQEDLFGKKSNFSWDSIYSILLSAFENNLSPLDQLFLADFNGKLLFNFNIVNNSINDYFNLNSFTPFLSPELISLSMRLPSSLKYDLQSNLGKLPLRKILLNFSVSSFLNHKKLGFSINTVSLWKNFGQKICKEFLMESNIEKNGLINGDWIKKYLVQDDLDIRYVNKFLGLLALEIWYRIFITKELTSTSKL